MRIIVIETKLAIEPINRRGITRDMATLSAAFVVPSVLNGDFLFTPVLGFNFYIGFGNALYLPLALFF